ncbi:MAG: EI24 domain-containing protein [Pseudomonadota bacterium]
MGAVLTAYGRALRSQLGVKMLLLSALPFLLSGALWAGVLYAGLQPLIDALQALFADHDGFRWSGSVLAALGLGVLKTLVVPLVAMLLLLPLMIMTALLFMGVAAMPVIGRHVARRQFPELEKKQGGSFLGSLATNLSGLLIFAALWLLTMPLYALGPLALLAQIALWAWLTARVMSYDALAAHASAAERATIGHTQRWPLLAIGMVSGAAGALPGIVWIGGTVFSVLLFPFLAAISIWLYVVIFIFTGLWFQYYCLQALEQLRRSTQQ